MSDEKPDLLGKLQREAAEEAARIDPIKAVRSEDLPRYYIAALSSGWGVYDRRLGPKPYKLTEYFPMRDYDSWNECRMAAEAHANKLNQRG